MTNQDRPKGEASIPGIGSEGPAHYRLFALLNRWHVPDPVYYWLLDRLTDNNGWRPLFYRERRGKR